MFSSIGVFATTKRILMAVITAAGLSLSESFTAKFSRTSLVTFCTKRLRVSTLALKSQIIY